jgi:nucleoid DNA-binding protein
MSTITKQELIDRIAETTQTTHSTTKAIIKCCLEKIVAELSKDNRLELRDFGVFESRTCAARTAQNPKTLERVRLPAKRAVKFKMGWLMKQKLDSQPSK